MLLGQGDRIDPSATERLTAEQAPQREPPAACHAVELDGVGSVLGARRLKPTGSRQQRRDEALVAPQHTEHRRLRSHDAHRLASLRKLWRNSVSSAAKELLTIVVRAFTTRSIGGRN